MKTSFSVWLETDIKNEAILVVLERMEESGLKFTDRSKGLFYDLVFYHSLTLSKERVRFARARVKDLGFREGEAPTTLQVWAKIKILGGLLCKPSDGLVIRREFDDQNPCGICWVAMPPVFFDGDMRIICLSCDADGVKSISAGSDAGNWGLEAEIMFRLP